MYESWGNMPDAYFIKVNGNVTWDQLLENTRTQIEKKNKALPYRTLIEISIDEIQFMNMFKNITTFNPVYLAYTSASISDSNGIWNCIVIKCASLNRGIVIYTAGRSFPLYIAQHLEV